MENEFNYNTKSEALKAVKKNGSNLKLCTPEFQNNEDVVMTAIKKYSWSFEYASDTLKNNKDFILKALNEGVDHWGLLKLTPTIIQSDLEVITLAVEKSDNGLAFFSAKGDVALNKELVAKALVKWGSTYDSDDLILWNELHPTIQEFFPKDSWYKKAQLYLYQLEQEKRAEMVAGGSTLEDEVVW